MAVGFLRDLIAGRNNALTEVAAGRRVFATSVDSGTLYATPTLDDYIYGRRRVPRDLALSVPAVKRARDLIAGALGGLSMDLVDGDGVELEGGWSLLDQPEPDRAASVTWTEVAEDLLFEKYAYLFVTHVGWHGKPAEVRRIDPTTWTGRPETMVVQTATGSGTVEVWPADARIIRVESPNEALLTAGARAIRTLVALGETTNLAASGLPPISYFTPKDGQDVLDDDEIQDILDDWFKARQKGITGYVPGALDLKELGWNPEQLQLKDLRDQAVLDIARLTGVDAEELSVSTTSRTYFNAWDRKQDFIQFTLGPYLGALAGRLSMPDVTPRGYRVRHDLDEFFKADTLARFQGYEIGLRTGAITIPEIREAEGRPALTESQIAAIAAIAARTPRTKEIADAAA